ncbi:MAG: hypothetical protein WD397_07045 [Wenzhouxiangellaceae bacterium]
MKSLLLFCAAAVAVGSGSARSDIHTNFIGPAPTANVAISSGAAISDELGENNQNGSNIRGNEPILPLISQWQFLDHDGNIATATSVASIDTHAGTLRIESVDKSVLDFSWDYGPEGVFLEVRNDAKSISVEIIPIKASPSPNNKTALGQLVNSHASSILHLNRETPDFSKKLTLFLTGPKTKDKIDALGNHSRSTPEDLRIDGVSLNSHQWESSAPAKKIADFQAGSTSNGFTQSHLNLLHAAIQNGRHETAIPVFVIQLIDRLDSHGSTSNALRKSKSPVIQDHSAGDVISCGLICASAGVGGALTAYSGGSLSAPLFFAAAGCGTCLGQLTAPDLPPPAFIGPGTGGSVGGSLPSLPPGYIWVCETFGEDGETVCRPVPKMSIHP